MRNSLQFLPKGDIQTDIGVYMPGLTVEKRVLQRPCSLLIFVLFPFPYDILLFFMMSVCRDLHSSFSFASCFK